MKLMWLPPGIVLGLWVSPAVQAAVLIGLNPTSSPPGVYATGPTYVVTIETTPFSVSGLGTVTGEMLSGLDVQPGPGALYASSGRNGAHPGSLFRLDRTTGAATLIGQTGFGGVETNHVPGIAFDLDGTLFGSAVVNGLGSLIKIDPATGAGTLVGAHGYPGGSILPAQDAIAIHPTTGVLYAIDGGLYDNTPGDIFTINKATGEATLIGSLPGCLFVDEPVLCVFYPEYGIGRISGLAFDPAGNLFASFGHNDGRIILVNLTGLTWSIQGDGTPPGNPAAGSISDIAFLPALPDGDGDGVPDASDNCPVYASAVVTDTDQDGRGDVCECTDQDGNGRNTVSDLIAINTAIFNPTLATPLCDGNNDGLCNVSDIIAANIEIFSPTNTSTCARQPVPGP